MMEHGFFHPERGYWQAIAGSVEELMPSYPGGTINVPIKPGPHYEWSGGEWVDVGPAVEPVPQAVSRRQFYQGLAVAQFITNQEALDAIRMVSLPAAIQAMVDGMEDEDAKFEASSLLYGAGEFRRDHPLVMVFAAVQEMSEEDVDDFWRVCDTL